MILDLFAGPGGWDVGARRLGLDPIGVELDRWACATRAAAGLRTVRADVSQFRVPGSIVGLIASPPCPTFSNAGKGEGMWDLPWLHRFVEDWSRHGWRDPWRLHDWSDPRTPLVLEPLRFLAAEPDWVVLEQVPPVLPLWEQYAAALQALGWRGVWAGVLNAADYGVPQTRRRAVLIAHRHRPVAPPDATHAEHPAPTLFGPELLPWVSMAEALGWGRTHAPIGCLTTRAHTGNGAGGSNQRRARDAEVDAGLWIFDRPATTLTGSALAHGVAQFVPVVLNPGATESQPNRRRYSLDEPAPTVAFGHDAGNWRWEAVGDACPGCGCEWHYHDQGGYCAGPCGGNRCDGDLPPHLARRNDQSGPPDDPDWPLHRPATTIAGRDLVGDPGANANRFNDSTKSRNDGIRITEADALLLQSFPGDYPVQGTKSQRFLQIGNAVPPLLAEHVLRVVTR